MDNHMQAIVYDAYGPPEVLHFRQVPRPEPRPGEVLIKVRATTVTAGDWRMRKPEPALLARLYNGLLRPKRVTILGFELAGDVVALGSGVTRFHAGDPVFASCGLGFGGYAGYRCLPAGDGSAKTGLVAAKPRTMSYEEAAAVPLGGLAALNLLRLAGLASGQKVLIYGASGSVGTFAVQIARAFDAEVTGVCSTRNMALVRSLGAAHVVDYTQEDFAARPERYDLVFDAVDKAAKADCRRVLRPDGRYINVGQGRHDSAADLETLHDLIEAGQLRSVIDRVYPWQEIVAAHHYVEQGHKVGNVAITVA